MLPLPNNAVFQFDLAKVINNFVAVFNISKENAHRIAVTIFNIQRTLSEGQSFNYLPSESFPYHLIIKDKKVYWKREKIGEGTTFDVFKVSLFPTTRFTIDEKVLTPSKPPEVYALKSGRSVGTTVSPEKRLIDELEKDGPLDGADRYLDISRDQDGRQYTVHQFYDGDLNKKSFIRYPNPLQEMLKDLIPPFRFIEKLHEKDIVHRDLKKGNVLYSEAKGQTVVTDFGLLRKEADEVHHTTGTVAYLDPYVFGEEKNLIAQRDRQGIQNKRADAFAAGRLVMSLILSLLRELSSRIPADERASFLSTFNQLIPKKEDGRFSDEQLIEIDRLANFQVMLEQTKKNPDPIYRLYLFPFLNTSRRLISGLCSQLNDAQMDKKNRDALICLANLACDLQEAPDQRSTIKQARIGMEKLLAGFEENHAFTPLRELLRDREVDTPSPLKRSKADLSLLFEDLNKTEPTQIVE